MIIAMNRQASDDHIKEVILFLENLGLKAHLSRGEEVTIIGVVGDKGKLVGENLELLPGVEKLIPVTETYKLSNRKFKPSSTVIHCNGVAIGGNEIVIMGGPCAVESREQLLASARFAKEGGAKILRGGAYKPRTSPYSFQGMEEEGLKIMAEARDETGLSIISEVTSQKAAETAVKYVDILQVGARNMQNFELLKEIGKTGIPVLLKRGLSATIEEWLNAAEYIMSEGNQNVILCERGIRTFETATRNTLDISAIPVIKNKSHLPIVVDPSHGTGVRAYVPALSKASVAAGCDGLIIEMHPNPSKALSDGPQSLNPVDFKKLVDELKPIAAAVERTL